MKKIIIYQLLPRLFSNKTDNNVPNGTINENGCGKFNDIRASVIDRIAELGVSHIWLTGVIRHSSKTSYRKYNIRNVSCSTLVKGMAGSPYAIIDYYDVDPDLAVDVKKRMSEFERLVELIHHKKMKLIIDFVPNHVARQYHSTHKHKRQHDLGSDDDVTKAFSPSNNFYYCVDQPFAPTFDKGKYTEYPARATGNDKFDPHPGKDDWYETIKLNYGVDYLDPNGPSGHFDPIPDTWFKMLDILDFWAGKGIDGVRCDMAEMVPPEFWSWATSQIKERYPGFIFIGEVYNPSLYRTYISSGFDYLYDKVGMYDCMRRIMTGSGSATEITRQWQNTDDITGHMLYFLENHDEQRIASDFFAGNALKGIPALISCLFMNKNPFMLYAGQEYGERGMDSEGYSGCDGRTSIFDYWSLESLRYGYFDRRSLSIYQKRLQKSYSSILKAAVTQDAVTNGKFFDLMYANLDNDKFDKHSVFTFIRKSEHQTLLVASNFSDEDRDVEIIIPAHAFDFLQIIEGQHIAEDIFSKKKHILYLTKDCRCKLHIGANDGIVLSFTSEI